MSEVPISLQSRSMILSGIFHIAACTLHDPTQCMCTFSSAIRHFFFTGPQYSQSVTLQTSNLSELNSLTSPPSPTLLPSFHRSSHQRSHDIRSQDLLPEPLHLQKLQGPYRRPRILQESDVFGPCPVSQVR